MATSASFGPSVRLHRVLVAAAVLVPALTFIAAAWQNRADVLSEGRETVQRTAAVLQEHARKVFETEELVLARVDEHIAGQSWEQISDPGVTAYLGRVKAPLEHAVSIWITDPTGTVRAGSQAFEPGVNHADRDFFRSHVDADIGTYVSSAFVGRATAASSFAVSRRRTAQGGFDGIIHIAVAPEYFQHFFAEAAPPLPHVATLFRLDGAVLAQDPPGPSLGVQAIGDIPALRAADGRAVVTARSPEDGRERTIAYRRVGSYPLAVAFAVDKNVLLHRWYHNLRIYGAVAGVASLVLLLVSLLALRRAQAEEAALLELRGEITEREKVEGKLRQAQKMEAVGQLTGGLAHDFNNLLSVISGNAALLQQRVEAAEPRRLAEAILRAAERGAALTRQLLAFSRLQKLEVARVDLNLRIRDMKDMLGRSLRANVVVRTDLQPTLWPVEVDANQLELAILNVAVNARDAMPSGGTLTIRTRNATLDRPDLQGDHVVLSLGDTGTGMTAEQRERACEPFFTTKDIGKGTGLGLSMVYGFARQSGGTLEIDSAPGAGTTVTLYLPRSIHAGNSETAEPAELTPADLESGDVLIVEDDAEVGAVTLAFVEQLGFRVRMVPGAADALELLAWDTPPALMISDMYMPGQIGGLELAHEARRRLPDLGILLVTGAHEAADEARAAGFAVLMKPFRQHELAAAMNLARNRHDTAPG